MSNPGSHPLSLQLLSEASGEIAHDLNNALTVILGNLSMAMSTRGISPEVRERLVASKVAGLRAQKLCQQLQDFAGASTAVPEPVDIALMLREVVESIRPESLFKTEFSFPPDLWSARVDPSRFSLGLENLIGYLHRAAPPESSIRVLCANSQEAGSPLPPSQYVEITLSCDGQGIPQDHIPALFNCEYRKLQKDVGFGLASAYATVHAHEGTIRVTSNRDEGIALSIFIPASPPQALTARAPSAPANVPLPAPAPQRPLRILILDDEPVLCELLMCALEGLGHAVTISEDGAETVATYQRALGQGHHFDLVICDLTLPGGIDGLEVCTRVRKLDPSARVAICSGASRNPAVEHFRDHGFCALLPKPYEIEKLHIFLADALSVSLPE